MSRLFSSLKVLTITAVLVLSGMAFSLLALPRIEPQSLSFSKEVVKSEPRLIVEQARNVAVSSAGPQQKIEDYELIQVLNEAKQFWTDKLGFNPWKNWNIPVNWDAHLGDNKDVETLGSTYTRTGTFPLKTNYPDSVVNIDMNRVRQGHRDLKMILVHELGHALGLDHSTGIMTEMVEDITPDVSQEQIKQVTTNYNLGH